ncbi:MAG: adenylosuccinate lyase [Dysgonamonadaceae bacterium]|jgi:adenylosuccinate lyase|nr:adenylosuccinate lyase [Dysgonamonadaceae bacterium]
MELSILTAISPVDGRYRDKVENLSEYFSEWAFIRYRIRVEIEYFIFLCELLPPLQSFPLADEKENLRNLYRTFSTADATRVKQIETTTNHDVKAVEYFLKERFDAHSLQAYKEFIHFGLTSQDINNTSIPLMMKEALEKIYYPEIQSLIDLLKKDAQAWKEIPMLAKTHGQPASPTRLGKEIMVFAYRLEQQLKLLKTTPLSVKFGGATGNFNAHHVAFPAYDWQQLANRFVRQHLGLEREEWTTQISNYDNLAALFDGFCRINTICIDLCRDFWQYISMDYFKQKITPGEVGSSAMPHKINPIDFENAEGNLGIANATWRHLSNKLPLSRLQRDLTDSTVLRNIGIPLAHTTIALKSITKGLNKLLLNSEAIASELNNHWAVVAEAIQTILRRENYPEPYETLKEWTRINETITKQSIHRLINSLHVKEDIKNELKAITPQNYTGI